MKPHWSQPTRVGALVQTDGSSDASSPFRDRGPLEDSLAIRMLMEGELDVLGRMPWSSNATFLVDISFNNSFIQGVYKPSSGERPLHDFPPGIYIREVATWELAKQLGWGMIPPTVTRSGPLGKGSIQLYIPCDYEQHYFSLRDNPSHLKELKKLAVFDLISNNTDRKAGHVLEGKDGKIWAVDNALNFHHQFKVRTVIWDWAGEPIDSNLIDDLNEFLSEGPSEPLLDLLTAMEVDALISRVQAVCSGGTLPHDTTGRRVPWPLL